MNADNPLTLLGSITPRQFLAEYWQKKPLLVRNAFPGWQNPLEPDELAGLACEEEAESRIVLEREGKEHWVLRQGPFDEETFATLPKTRWTLLVQAVDQWVEEVQALLEPFRFIPDWRIDDVMVSYAPEGGSVGPHYDYYDVFLIQGLGQREWQVGPECGPDTPRREDTELRILADMPAEHRWVLEPGDMLYLPPRYAHWGVALNDCMTYSVGFRSVSHAELLDHITMEATAEIEEDQRYADPDLQAPENPGEIPRSAIGQLRSIIERYMLDDERLLQWFGQFVTEPKYPDQDLSPEETLEVEDLLDAIEAFGGIERHPACRLAFSTGDAGFSFFANGFATQLHSAAEQALARALCANKRLDETALAPFLQQPECTALLCELHNRGCLWFES